MTSKNKTTNGIFCNNLLHILTLIKAVFTMFPSFLLAIENEEDRNFLMEHYIKLYPLLYKLVNEISHDRHLTEDIIHDAMIRLIDKLDFIKNKEAPVQVSYIVRTAVNTAKNYVASNIRRRKHTYIGNLEDLSDTLQDLSDPPEEKIFILCDYEALGHAMERLSERDRDLLYSKYVMEMNDEEIARELNIDVKNIRSYFSRARKRALDFIREEETRYAQ